MRPVCARAANRSAGSAIGASGARSAAPDHRRARATRTVGHRAYVPHNQADLVTAAWDRGNVDASMRLTAWRKISARTVSNPSATNCPHFTISIRLTQPTPIQTNCSALFGPPFARSTASDGASIRSSPTRRSSSHARSSPTAKGGLPPVAVAADDCAFIAKAHIDALDETACQEIPQSLDSGRLDARLAAKAVRSSPLPPRHRSAGRRPRRLQTA